MQEQREVPLHRIVGRRIRSEARVEFSHVDPYRHMTTAAYLEMAINHRFRAVLDVLGFDTLALAEDHGIAFINRDVHMEFRNFANLDEALTIESWVEEVHASRMVVLVEIRKKVEGSLCCRIRLDLSTFDLRQQRLIPVPKSLPSRRQEPFEQLPWAEGHPKTDVPASS